MCWPRVIYFADVKLNNFQEAQEKAEKMIFIQYQNAASEYLKGFKGSPYYLKNVEGILCVTGRKIEGVHKTMKLVPPGSSLYKQVTNWAHKSTITLGPITSKPSFNSKDIGSLKLSSD